jgi:HSP20 family molecular chaperone IbpA
MATSIPVKKVLDPNDRTEPVFAAAEALCRSIQKKAYDLFERSGFSHGHALEDWLRAERELSWPAAELKEDETSYQFDVALPGYAAGEIDVAVTPQEIIVNASSQKRSGSKPTEQSKAAVRWSEFKSNQVCRRIDLADSIDVNQTIASLQDGMLTIKAAKQARESRKIVPVDVAA